MSRRRFRRPALGLFMLTLGACGAPGASDEASDADEAVVTAPALTAAYFVGRSAHIALATPLDGATFDLSSVRLSSPLVMPDGTLSEATLVRGAVPGEDGRTLLLSLDETPVLGRVYDITVERLDGGDAAKLGQIWADEPEELREDPREAAHVPKALPGLIGGGAVLDPGLIARFAKNNTDYFVAKRTDPATTTARPGLLYRRDHVDASGAMLADQQETRAITVFFGHRNKPEGADHIEPAERIDCSWIPRGTRDGSPETNRNVFRISTTRPGSGKGQLMFADAAASATTDYFYRGRISCDPIENSLTFHLPGRLLGAADVTLYAVAKSVGGYYAEREYQFRVENPDVRVDLTKLRQEGTACVDFGWDLGCQGRRLPNTYVASATAVNTGHIVEDATRGVFPAQVGPWENLRGGQEVFPANTRLYSGPVGVSAELALAAMSDNDTRTEALLSQIWKVSSQIFCATFSYCPSAVIAPAGEAHDLITAGILAEGDDRSLGGVTLPLLRYDLPGASTLIGANWGLDLRPGQTYDYRWGYPILIESPTFGSSGNVTVWLKFIEAQPSWQTPVDLF